MKLQGVRVLDLSMFLPGPQLTMTMADHGAQVIRIEPPGEGEPTRHLGFRKNGQSVWFRNTHRGKRSVTLDLKTEPARELLLRLAERSQVLVEAFRPGVMKRLQLDYEQVARRAPHIVYCSISAFGQVGPLSHRVAHDLAVEAQSGIASLTLGQDGKPALPAIPMADMAASLMALSGILMALYRARETGRGDYIDLSMQDALMAWTPNLTGRVFAEDRAPEVKNERTWGGNAMYNVYETADGQWLVLGGSEIKFAANLLIALGRPELIELCKLPAGEGQAPVRAYFRKTFRTRTLEQWLAWLEGRDICYAPVLDLHQAFHQPHVAARAMLLRDDEGNDHIGVPLKFRHEPAIPRFAVPGLGEHNREVCALAGYDATGFAALAAAGAFGPTVAGADAS